MKKDDHESREDEIADRTSPPGEVVYQAVYDEGEHELTRTHSALALSGLAAGLSMGFSLAAEGLLAHLLPPARWTELITKLGYSVGFIITILGRQQLFTKTTLTVVLPLLKHRTASLLWNVLRIWALVLGANLVGALGIAWLFSGTHVFDVEVRHEMLEAAKLATSAPFLDLMLKGMVAGWLVALMVWLLPFAEAARIWVIVMLAYLIGLGGLPHVVAGSVEIFYRIFAGSSDWYHGLVGYLLPTLAGNTIGGVALVAVGAHTEYTVAK